MAERIRRGKAHGKNWVVYPHKDCASFLQIVGVLFFLCQMRKTGNYLAQTESSLRAETLMKSQKKGQVR